MQDQLNDSRVVAGGQSNSQYMQSEHKTEGMNLNEWSPERHKYENNQIMMRQGTHERDSSSLNTSQQPHAMRKGR